MYHYTKYESQYHEKCKEQGGDRIVKKAEGIYVLERVIFLDCCFSTKEEAEAAMEKITFGLTTYFTNVMPLVKENVDPRC